MSVERAKQRLAWQPGEPAAGYVQVSDVQASYDDLADAWTAAIISTVTDGADLSGFATDDELNEAVTGLVTAIETEKGRITTANEFISQNSGMIADLTTRLNDTDQAVTDLGVEVTETTGMIADLTTRLDATDQAVIDLGVEVTETTWSYWSGTQAEYDALPAKDAKTLYVVV